MTPAARDLSHPESSAPLTALGVGVFALICALVPLFEQDASPRAVVTVAGLTACAVLLLSPRVFAALKTWSPRSVGWFVGLLTLWTLLLPADRFDPYMLTIVLATTVACSQGATQLAGRLTAVAVVLWLVLWLPLDLRVYRPTSRDLPGFFFGNELGYDTWALFTACMGILTFGVAGRFDLGIQRASLKAPLVGLAFGLVFSAVAIPVGLASGFLEFENSAPPTVEAAAEPGAPAEPEAGLSESIQAGLIQLAVFFVIALTIALPEELFFRGVLDRGLERRWKRPWLALVVSSLLFGLMHWNNRSGLDDKLLYFGLATLAGVAYGLAFRKGGLLSAIFVHALVDWVWQLEFVK